VRATASSELQPTSDSLVLGRLRSALDFLSDYAVLLLASWTALAYFGMITEAKVSILVLIWIATAPLLALALHTLRPERSAEEPDEQIEPEPGEEEDTDSRLSEQVRESLPFIGIGAGILAGVLAAWAFHVWALVWLPALVAAVVAVVAGKLTSRRLAEVSSPTGWAVDLFVVGTGLVFSAMSLLLFRPNPDDVFYVNRATAVAELNRIPVLDVIFTHEEVARAGGAGLPVDSYSALQGALARLFSVEAPNVAYYLFPPVFTFLATWALWRLVRAWAPRGLWVCFALGCVFWVMSAEFGLTPGNYFLTRIWQGKVAFVAWLIPLIYVYLTRWLTGRDTQTAVLLLAAGLGAIGATGSATFVAPLVFAAALIPLVARREWRALPIPLAAAAIPAAIGSVALWRFPLSETIGIEPLRNQAYFFHVVFGTGVVCAIATAGLWVGPWAARAGAAQRVTTGLAIVSVILTAPGMVAFVSDLSGLTGTLRRLLWVVPLPALVGMLAAIPLAVGIRRLGGAGPVLAAVLTGLLIAFGHPLWSVGPTSWQFPPIWKMYLEPEARAVLRQHDGRGTILGPPGLMRAISVLTADPKTVNARTTYLVRTREDPERIQMRLMLTNFAWDVGLRPTDQELRRALSELDVSLVCLDRHQTDSLAQLRDLATYREVFEVGRFICFDR
jgi:Family of unknown function (DUF6077)